MAKLKYYCITISLTSETGYKAWGHYHTEKEAVHAKKQYEKTHGEADYNCVIIGKNAKDAIDRMLHCQLNAATRFLCDFGKEASVTEHIRHTALFNAHRKSMHWLKRCEVFQSEMGSHIVDKDTEFTCVDNERGDEVFLALPLNGYLFYEPKGGE